MATREFYRAIGVGGYEPLACWQKEWMFFLRIEAPQSCHRCPKCGTREVPHRRTLDRIVPAPPIGLDRTQLFRRPAGFGLPSWKMGNLFLAARLIKAPRLECKRCGQVMNAVPPNVVPLCNDTKSFAPQHDVLLAQRESVISQREVVIASQHDTIEKQLKKLAGLEQQRARLLRRQYEPQKERLDPDQLTLFTAEELAELVAQLQQIAVDSVSTDDGVPDEESADKESPAEPPQTTPKPQRKGHERRPIPPHIPRETIVHELNGEDRFCPCCGRPRTEIGREVSEQLEFIPAESPRRIGCLWSALRRPQWNQENRRHVNRRGRAKRSTPATPPPNLGLTRH